MKKWIACIWIGLLSQVYGQQAGTVFIQPVAPRLIEQRIEYSRVNFHNLGCRRYDLVILPDSILPITGPKNRFPLEWDTLLFMASDPVMIVPVVVPGKKRVQELRSWKYEYEVVEMPSLYGIPAKYASYEDRKRKSVFSWSGNARMIVISNRGGGYIVIDP